MSHRTLYATLATVTLLAGALAAQDTTSTKKDTTGAQAIQDTTAARKDTTAAVPAAPVPAVPDNAVKPGMTADEVKARWGEPVAIRSANDWTYFFYRNGRERKVGYYDVVMLQGGQVMDAIVRSPDHTYAGVSSSPEGRVPVFTPPQPHAVALGQRWSAQGETTFLRSCTSSFQRSDRDTTASADVFCGCTLSSFEAAYTEAEFASLDAQVSQGKVSTEGITKVLTECLASAAAARRGGATLAPGRPIRSDRDLSDWTTFYYRHPEPERLVEAFQYYVRSPLFARESARAPLSQFFAVAMNGNGPLLDRLSAAAGSSGSSEARSFALRILWRCGCQPGRRLLQSAPAAWGDPALVPVVTALLAEAPPDVLRSPPRTASDLDVRWATFFAAGASGPVEQIASVLDDAETGVGMQKAVGLAAQWSLTSNAIQHPRVLTILRDIQGRATGTQARLLAGIIAAAEQRLPRGNP